MTRIRNQPDVLNADPAVDMAILIDDLRADQTIIFRRVAMFLFRIKP
jgi:hypothetical protein